MNIITLHKGSHTELFNDVFRSLANLSARTIISLIHSFCFGNWFWFQTRYNARSISLMAWPMLVVMTFLKSRRCGARVLEICSSQWQSGARPTDRQGRIVSEPIRTESGVSSRNLDWTGWSSASNNGGNEHFRLRICILKLIKGEDGHMLCFTCFIAFTTFTSIMSLAMASLTLI